MTHLQKTGTAFLVLVYGTCFLCVCHWHYGVEQCSTRCRKSTNRDQNDEYWFVSCVVCLYKLCCLLFYCFKINWGDSSIEKLIQKFGFQFHLVRKTGTRKLVPVFWYQFSVPISGACVFGINDSTYRQTVLLPGSPMILVFWGLNFSRNSNGNTPNGGVKCKGVEKSCNFRPISRCSS